MINTSYRLAPWADMLYATDFSWWEQHDGVPDFAGLKVSQDPKIDHRPQWGIHRVVVDRYQDRLLVDTYGTIGWGGNSGFGALNLAVQFGVKRIILVGYDMRIDHGLHWHENHRGNNPIQRNVERWRRVIDEVAPAIGALGITVLNASKISTLRNYPKMSFDEAIGSLRVAA